MQPWSHAGATGAIRYIAVVTAPPHVLAIDLGTSGPKVALVSAQGEVLGGESESVDLVLIPGGGAEQDPEQWWAAIAAATRRVMAKDIVPESDIVAISVTSQWSGTVAVDADGQAIGNAVIWMDSRGARYVDDLIGGPVRVLGYDPRKLARWIRLTGGAPSGSGKDPIAHILFLRHEHPEVYAAADVFLEPKDYLNLRLTGRAAASFDSIALHWLTDNRDPDAVHYDGGLLAFAGLDRSQFPELLPGATVLGGLTSGAASDLGLSAGTPVMVGTPDLHSAGIGAGTTRDFAAHLYIGTSSWIGAHVPFKKTDLIHNIASLPAPVPGRYLIANEQETAGKAIEWLADLLLPDATDRTNAYAVLNDIAGRTPAGAGGVIFTPWLYGERTPVEDATLRAGFFNQSLETGRDEMVRAVFEGVACNGRWLLGYVEKFAKRRFDPITMVGGGALSDLWCQVHADVFDRTILQAADPLWVNVRGAGLLALAGLSHVRWSDIDDLVPIAATFRPNPANRATYDRLSDAFRRIHKANRRIYGRLNRSSLR
jgi:xylulokinase